MVAFPFVSLLYAGNRKNEEEKKNNLLIKID
jgi:hypothetical protein